MQKQLFLLLASNVVLAFGFLQAQETRTVSFPKQTEYPQHLPAKNNLWVFILAGQSNMAGRARVEPQDTVSNPRILTINKAGEIILAKEPLHFYEPAMTGLDCGLSFARSLLQAVPDSVSFLVIPTAVGGSSLDQWLGDSLFRDVRLLTNLKEKIDLGKKYGAIKALLWHQGESDAKETKATSYRQRLGVFLQGVRGYVQDRSLPVFAGGIGVFARDSQWQNEINRQLADYVKEDKRTFLIQTDDFRDKGDKLHFDSPSQRLMGERMAALYVQTQWRRKSK